MRSQHDALLQCERKERERDARVGSSRPISVSRLPHEIQGAGGEGVVWGAVVTHILAPPPHPRSSSLRQTE